MTVEKDDIVLDLGSNIGLFSTAVARRCKKVYAFEPIENAYIYIRMSQNNYSNIVLCPCAVGNSIGNVVFSDSNDATYTNQILHTDVEKVEQGQVIVPITTIDAFVDDRKLQSVDFIKSDIEGAERDMLRGAKNTLRRFAPKLSICEYHLPDDPEVLESIVLDANPNYIVEHDYMKMYAYVPDRRRHCDD